MNALRRVSFGELRRVALALGLALGGLALGCSGSGGGGGGDLVLLSFNLDGVRSVFLNERLVFKFSSPVDPGSVNANTIRIRYDASRIDRNADGQPDNPNDTNAAPRGTFTVDGDTVFFDPRLPIRCDNSDTGLVPSHTLLGTSTAVDIVYSVTIPAPTDSSPASIEDTRGRGIARTFQSTFQTVFDAAFPPDISSSSFFDVFPGRPFIRSLTATPSQFAADPNTTVSLLFSEPILPSSLCEGDAVVLEAISPNTGRIEQISASLTVEQLPAATRLSFRPTVTLPGGIQVNIRVTDEIRDFGGNRLSLTEPGTPPLFIQVMSTTAQSGFFQETFDTQDNEDVEATGASWLGGVLLPGGGGDASDGPFRPTANTVIDTTVKSLYQFSVFEIPENIVVTVTGPNPCRIFAASTATLVGRLSLNGMTAPPADSAPSPGGQGVAGGGAGGDGAGGPGGTGGNGFGPGGGFGSLSSAADTEPGTESASGGGGGSYGTPTGEQGDNTGRPLPPGLPGPSYGDPSLDPDLGLLLGGSGGGGSGWGDRPNQQGVGAGGGGGGGALQLHAGRGISLLRGLNLAGSISADGGDGSENTEVFGAGGGGGSGGGILLQAATGNILIANDGKVTAVGGAGGETPDDLGVQNKGRGGAGGPGRIRAEVNMAAGFALVVADDSRFDPIVNPVGGAQIDLAGVVSVGTSQFFDTRTLFPNYSFVPGDVIPGVGLPYTEDNAFLFPQGTIVYLFQGAPEDPLNPGLPNLADLRPPTFTFNIDEVDDSRFIRFQVLFVTPDPVPLAPPAVEAVRFSYTFN